MSEHPGDTPVNRFRAFMAGLIAFVSFGIVLWVALKVAGPNEAIEPGWAERGKIRAGNLVQVRAAQEAALSSDAVASVKKSTLESLKSKKPGKSEFVVPGSPTFLKQSQAPAEEAPAEEKKEGAPTGEKKEKAPAEEKKQEASTEGKKEDAPAEEKAAAPKPVPAEKPAAKKPEPKEKPAAAK